MSLLVSVRHVCAHLDGHRHSVSVQISINLGKIFPSKISHMKNFTDLNLGECLSVTKYSFHQLDGNMGLPFQLAQAIQDFKRVVVPCVSADNPPCTFRVLWGCLYDQCRKLRTRSSRDRYMMVTKRSCGSFLLKVEECVHQRTRQGVIMLKSRILLKLGTIVGCVEILPSTRISVAILNSLGDTRSPRPPPKK